MLSENSLVKQYNIAAEETAAKTHYAFARAAIEREYCGVCDIRSVTKAVNSEGITECTEQLIIENQPCRLSFERIKSAESTETAANFCQSAKLYIAPEISVPNGSLVTVWQNGVTRVYNCSGAAVYPTHQEIMLELASSVSEVV